MGCRFLRNRADTRSSHHILGGGAGRPAEMRLPHRPAPLPARPRRRPAPRSSSPGCGSEARRPLTPPPGPGTAAASRGRAEPSSGGRCGTEPTKPTRSPPRLQRIPVGGKEPSEPPPPASPRGGVEQHLTQKGAGSSHCSLRASLLRLHPTQQKAKQQLNPSLCCLSAVNKDNRSRQMQLKVPAPLLWIRRVRWAVGVCAFWSWSG